MAVRPPTPPAANSHDREACVREPEERLDLRDRDSRPRANAEAVGEEDRSDPARARTRPFALRGIHQAEEKTHSTELKA
jgi:hypothetical protein